MRRYRPPKAYKIVLDDEPVWIGGRYRDPREVTERSAATYWYFDNMMCPEQRALDRAWIEDANADADRFAKMDMERNDE